VIDEISSILSDGSVTVTWEVWIGWSNQDIASLLRTSFASNVLKKMPGSPTGTVAASDTPRRPEAGPPEKRRQKDGLKALLRKMKISS
jgi:hypothetical protein